MQRRTRTGGPPVPRESVRAAGVECVPVAPSTDPWGIGHDPGPLEDRGGVSGPERGHPAAGAVTVGERAAVSAEGSASVGAAEPTETHAPPFTASHRDGAARRQPPPGSPPSSGLLARGLGPLVALLAALVLAVMTTSAYWGWRLSHPPRLPVRGNPGTAADLVWRCLPGLGWGPCTAAPLTLAGGAVPLTGWLLPATPSGTGPGLSGRATAARPQGAWPGTSPGEWARRTVVFVPDVGQNRLQSGFPVLDVARTLVAHGYNVVLFDPRGTGGSGGEGVGFGVVEAADVQAVVDYLQTLGPPGGAVAVWGFGTGADAAILAAAADPRIAALIADSPYADPVAFLRRNVPAWTGLPGVPFGWTVPWTMARETGVPYARVSPLAAVSALGGRPLLLVAGGADSETPPREVRALYAAARDRYGQTLIVPGAGHLQAFARASGTYMSRVMEILGEM